MTLFVKSPWCWSIRELDSCLLPIEAPCPQLLTNDKLVQAGHTTCRAGGTDTDQGGQGTQTLEPVHRTCQRGLTQPAAGYRSVDSPRRPSGWAALRLLSCKDPPSPGARGLL